MVDFWADIGSPEPIWLLVDSIQFYILNFQALVHLLTD